MTTEPDSILRDAAALLASGRAATAQQRVESLPRAARERDPRAADLLLRALLEQGLFEDAAKAARDAAKAHPRSPDIRGHHAAACFRLGRLHDAMVVCREALRLAPGHPTAVQILVDARIFARRTEGLVAEVEPHARAERAHPRILLALAKACEAEKQDDRALATLDRLTTDPAAPAPLRREAEFTRGRLLERRADFAGAFAAFSRANVPTAGTYDRARRRTLNDALIARTSREALTGAPASGQTSQLPVYIVGMPRSGTTLVEQISGAHPRAAALGERPDIFLLARRLEQSAPDTAPRPVREAALRAAAADQLALLKRLAPSADRALDKNPFNFRSLALLQSLFPACRVIHCVRDPIDTCLSCWTQQFEYAQDFTATFPDLAPYYADYLKLMAHFAAVLDLPILDVRYETLVADPEAGARRLLDFLGLEWNDACLHPHESARFAMTASHEQVRRPVYTSSVGRWRRYEPHVRPLIDALRREGVPIDA